MVTFRLTGPDKHFDKAADLLHSGQIEDAIKEFKISLEISPGHFDSFNNLGLCFASLNQFEEGLKWFEEALRIKPNHATTHYHKGLLLKKLGRFRESLSSIKIALDLRPNNEKSLILMGNVYSELGDLLAGIECFNQTLNINPHNSLARSNKLISLKILGLDDEVEKVHQEGSILDRDDINSLIAEAKNNFQLNNFQEALINVNKALKLQSDHPELHLYKNKTLERIKELEAILKLKPSTLKERYNKIMKLFQFNKYDEVIKCCDEILKSNPNNVKILVNKSIALTRMKKFEESINFMKKALKLDPNSPEILTNLAMIYNNNGNYKQALIYFDKALKINPNYSKATKEKQKLINETKIKESIFCPYCGTKINIKNNNCSNCGKLIEPIYKSSGIVEDKTLYENFSEQVKKPSKTIEEAFEKSKELLRLVYQIEIENQDVNLSRDFEKKYKSSDIYRQIEFLEELVNFLPNNKWLWGLLEQLSMEVRNLGQSVVYAKKIVKIDPSDDDAWNRLGWMYILQGEFEKAFKCLNKVFELNPNNISLLKNFSLIYEVIGDKEKALSYLRIYLDKNPYDDEAYERRDKLLQNCSEILGVKEKVRETLGWGYYIEFSNIQYVDEKGVRINKITSVMDEDDYEDW